MRSGRVCHTSCSSTKTAPGTLPLPPEVWPLPATTRRPSKTDACWRVTNSAVSNQPATKSTRSDVRRTEHEPSGFGSDTIERHLPVSASYCSTVCVATPVVAWRPPATTRLPLKLTAAGDSRASPMAANIRHLPASGSNTSTVSSEFASSLPPTTATSPLNSTAAASARAVGKRVSMQQKKQGHMRAEMPTHACGVGRLQTKLA